MGFLRFQGCATRGVFAYGSSTAVVKLEGGLDELGVVESETGGLQVRNLARVVDGEGTILAGLGRGPVCERHVEKSNGVVGC